MRKAVAEEIAGEVSEWGHKGLLGRDVIAVLMERYSVERTMRSVLLRWLGFIALALLASSALGFVGLMLGEVAAYLAPPLLAVFACVLWIKGTKMAIDPAQRFATSGAVLVTFSLCVGFAALAISYALLGGDDSRIAVAIMMLLTAAAAFFTAYRYGLRWPLLLGILMAFHALGHLHSYAGSGSYLMGIVDERIMLAAATTSLFIGLWHERRIEGDDHRLIGFGHVYIVFGLLYLNLSLWFLSTPQGDLIAVLSFAAAAVAQLIAGARLHDGRFTGFGIVFLSINLYTRMFENFWDEESKGIFFLAAGGIALVVGALFEHRARKLRLEASE
jgi:hypothetical protein